MNKVTLKLVLCGVVVFAASFAWAQQEQWLQYHFSARAGEIIGNNRRPPSPKLSSDPPAGVELPKFKGEVQVFTKWSTPMAQNGFLWIALDRSHTDAPLDHLFIDSNGNGHLDDETAIEPNRSERGYLYFGPVKVIFQGQDGPISYHFNFEVSKGSPLITLSSGGWYEGEITVGSKKVFCTLIDYTVNGTFNDMSANSWQCDRIRFGTKDEADMLPVGKYIQFDGKLYKPEIAQDGAYIKLEAAEDVVFGTIQMQESITEFTAAGENGLLTLKLDKGKGQLPVGKYRISQWTIERKDERGNTWKLKGQGFDDTRNFDIFKGGLTNLDLGEPINTTLKVDKKGNYMYSFGQSIKGRMGERIELTRNGNRTRPPKLHIKNKDGTYDRTFSFEYG